MFDHAGTPAHTGRAADNGTGLHYRTAGSGPAVVLLHGVPKYVRCYSMPGGIRAMLAIYRAMLVDAEQNRQATQRKLDIPVLALGDSALGRFRSPGVNSPF